MMRLFIAINFNTETRARLIALREELRSRSQLGNFTLDENLHLTLAFIGECDTVQAEKIKAIMDTVTFDPFPISILRLGTFSRGNERARSVATWWAGLREDKPLTVLQHSMSEGLRGAGFAPENRGYSPHITLGRAVVTDSKPWQFEPFGETVSRIELMKSERVGGKLTYTSIYRCGK